MKIEAIICLMIAGYFRKVWEIVKNKFSKSLFILRVISFHWTRKLNELLLLNFDYRYLCEDSCFSSSNGTRWRFQFLEFSLHEVRCFLMYGFNMSELLFVHSWKRIMNFLFHWYRKKLLHVIVIEFFNLFSNIIQVESIYLIFLHRKLGSISGFYQCE
jgi:hypothetical protein